MARIRIDNLTGTENPTPEDIAKITGGGFVVQGQGLAGASPNLQVRFNPKEITIQKPATWEPNSPKD